MARDQRLNVEITADDRASAKIDAAARKVEALDGEKATAKIEADSSGFDGVVEALDDKLGGAIGAMKGAAGPGGAAVALAAAIGFAANEAADLAIEADNTARLTGDSVEEASKLAGIWRQAGFDNKDLQDVLLQMNGVLRTSPELAKQLGINLDDGLSIGERFQQVVRILGSDFADAGQRSQMASQLFGEEGVRQVNAVEGAFGDLSAAVDSYSGRVFTRRDAEQAREFKRAISDLKVEFSEVATTIGSDVLPELTEMLKLVRDVRGAVEDVTNTVPGFDRLEGAVKDILNPVGFFADEIGRLKDQTDDLLDTEKELTDDLVANVQAQVAAATATEETATQVARYDERVEAVTQALENHAAAEARTRDEQRRNIETTSRLTDEYNDQRDAINDLIGDKVELVGGDIAVRQAQSDARDAVAELNTVLEEQSDDLGAVGAAIDDAAAKQIAAAEAAAEYRAKQLEANGTLVDSRVRNQLLKEEMERLAAQVDGPLRAAIQRYIDELGRIPTSVNTVVTANGTPASVPIVPGSRYASGTMSAKAGVALVGEEGPELVELNGGERIYNARETGKIMANQSAGVAIGGGGMSLTVAPGAIVIHGNASGEDIVRALDAYVRRGGIVPADVRRRFGNG